MDLLFPVFCFGCRKEGEFCCTACRRNIYLGGTVLSGEKLDRVIVAGDFDRGLIRDLLHQFKYNGIRSLSEILIENLPDWVERELKNHLDSLGLWSSVSIPMHWRRKAERGFNQSDLLAQEISKRWGLLYNSKILRKNRHTESQMTLDREGRLINLKNAFAVGVDAREIEGKNFLLVDDVYTTGTTLEECAGVLKFHGAASVIGLVLGKNRNGD
ncbi:MAG: phosphoribosyltransferase [Parcubacteria group bacterium Gr01-1014_18]|nr:MAG: phosphoribosyltransferase [Parcubacteria group bacterium Greene0416_36]TSC80036.1 MAG: phosphoribosyltransferase [Parcubacteria group bacterium Gr01-1014_18]TSD06612.1 MAG: phosphoribosyltransferase [Parcubacteria group bacterium Greene0714_2]